MAASALGRVLTGFGRRLTGKPRYGVEASLPSVHLGTSYGGYAVVLDGLGPDSIVYSFGLGEDISFDLALIERTGCKVFGFDPTPRSIDWVRSQALPPQLQVQGVGVAGHDGKVSFAPPKDPTHISHSMVTGAGAGRATIEVEVRRLGTLMGQLEHARLDVLKMDIEGAEYDVLDDLLRSSLRPAQLLVEFHHGHHGIPLSKTERCLAALRAAGYRVFDAQPSGHEFSLLHAP
jgi:FkbM family methyltransferase